MQRSNSSIKQVERQRDRGQRCNCDCVRLVSYSLRIYITSLEILHSRQTTSLRFYLSSLCASGKKGARTFAFTCTILRSKFDNIGISVQACVMQYLSKIEQHNEQLRRYDTSIALSRPPSSASYSSSSSSYSSSSSSIAASASA
jgi:hypothetical protein